ncbi:MAG: hypothetical protein KDC54_22840 [Lewinella sp.]|nr:hypothetical protein [Lewinella sp.]
MSDASKPISWEELIRLALLGTDRAPLPIEWLAEEADATGPPSRLLEAAYTQHLLRRGARPWAKLEGKLPATAPPEPGKACTWRAAQMLLRMLEGHHAAALPEFIRLLGQHQRVLPPAALPALLDQCVADHSHWAIVAPALGQRGHWLARQHPAWRELLPPDMASDWRTAPADEQAAAFRRQRQVDPEAARQGLLDAWNELEVKPRAQLLAALEEGLSLADEPFLENALDDSRKEVRQPASELLARLPDSALVKRLFAQATACLSYEKKKISLDLPDTAPAATKRDGIQPRGSKMPGGLTLNWLTQLLVHIPVHYWLAHWQVEPRQLVEGWFRAEYGLSLLHALTDSLLRHPHLPTQAAWAAYCLDTGNEKMWNHPAGRQLLATVPDEVFNRLLIHWLEQNGPLVPEETLAQYWLAMGTHSWNKRLSQLIIQGFQQSLQQTRGGQWQTWHYRRLLEVAAYQSDPALLEALRMGWNFRSTAARWEPEVERMLQTLHFRREMHKVIREG